MTLDFAALKANRNKMLETLENKLNEGVRTKDETYWQPTKDQAGNGSAIIRFLPPTKGEDAPYVKIWNHAFQGPKGQWYIENSLTTIGQNDPVSEHNQELYATGIDANKKLVSKRKRQLKYVSNIYVVKDPGNPENEGKVFRYKYGQKIMDQINAAWKPEFDDQEVVVPFDFWEGANFRLRMVKKDDFVNYDSSKFDAPGPLFTKKNGEADDEKIAAVWEQQYSLAEVIAPSQFKSYDDLKARFLRVIDESPRGGSSARAPALDEDDEPQAPRPSNTRRQAAKAEKTAAKSEDADEYDSSWFDEIKNEIEGNDED